jgi:hypothetical protein
VLSSGSHAFAIAFGNGNTGTVEKLRRVKVSVRWESERPFQSCDRYFILQHPAAGEQGAKLARCGFAFRIARAVLFHKRLRSIDDVHG